MWYFAYGSNLNTRAVAEWCRHFRHKPPGLKTGRPAVLDNYRLCFPIYSDFWGGGVADITYDAGKYVMGALFDLSEAEMAVLDTKVGRSVDAAGREMGIVKRINVRVSPLGKGEPTDAATYTGVSVEKDHIPPTRHYMDLMIQGTYTHGLSMMWIAYLQSFSTQPGRSSKPPSAGDAAARL